MDDKVPIAVDLEKAFEKLAAIVALKPVKAALWNNSRQRTGDARAESSLLM